ncbi:MAG: hypothetical protein O7G88_12055 [bacterium]|nr:hypothetical protein [bacterium]
MDEVFRRLQRSAAAIVSLPVWLRSQMGGGRSLSPTLDLSLSHPHMAIFAAIVL